MNPNLEPFSKVLLMKRHLSGAEVAGVWCCEFNAYCWVFTDIELIKNKISVLEFNVT